MKKWKMKDKSKQYITTGIHCVLILLALVGIFRFLKMQYIDEAVHSFVAKDIMEEYVERGVYTFTPDSDELSQTFTCTTDILWGLQMWFERDNTKSDGMISFRVENSRGSEVYQSTVPLGAIGTESPYKIVFDHIEQNAKGQVFKLSIKVADMHPEDGFRIVINDGQGYSGGTMQDASGQLTGNIRLKQIDSQSGYLDKLFWIFAAAITILMYGLYYFLFIKKIKMEYLFLFMVLTVGFMYIFLMQPGEVPDEAAHYRSAYAYSNIVLREGNGIKNPVVFRAEDYDYYHKMQDIYPDAYAYKKAIDNFGGKVTHTELKEGDKPALGGAGFLFFGGAAGITLGRILGMNALTVFYMGRVFNLLLFCGMAFWAFKKLPFYKMSLFAICLLPMTAQLTGSYSYDSMIIGLSLMLMAAILDYGYGKDSKAASKPKIRKLIQIGVLCALLGVSKGGAYIPLCALILLIPSRRFLSKKNRGIFLGGTVLGMVSIYILDGIGRVQSTINSGGNIVYWNGEPGYTVSWVLKNPGDFIQLISNTIFREGEFYIQSLFGKALGWFNYPIPGWIILGFMIVFLISAVHVTKEREAVIFSSRQKTGILICIILIVGAVVAALLFSHTPLSSDYIMGVQGRYLIPLLFPGVMCMKNRVLTLRHSIDRELVFSLAWLQVLAAVSILAMPLWKLMIQ
ncbi:MAG: DUF2142 domain-containing protein [Muricomes sp.]